MYRLTGIIVLALLLFSKTFAGEIKKPSVKAKVKSKQEIKKSIQQLVNEEIYVNSYALCIGIDDYKYRTKLNYAVKDAVEMKNIFEKMGFKETKVLLNETATTANILGALNELSEKANKDDRVVIYFSGHGSTDKTDRGDIGYIIPYDFPENGVNYISAISMNRVKEASKLIKAKHILYLIDSCYSGTGLVADKGVEEFAIKATRDPVVYIITAGKAGEESLETEGQGLFTKYIIKGLNGEADYDKNGIVTTSELARYLRTWVSNKAKDDYGRSQTPQAGRLDGIGEIVFDINISGKITYSNSDNAKLITNQAIDVLVTSSAITTDVSIKKDEEIEKNINKEEKIEKDVDKVVVIYKNDDNKETTAASIVIIENNNKVEEFKESENNKDRKEEIKVEKLESKREIDVKEQNSGSNSKIFLPISFFISTGYNLGYGNQKMIHMKQLPFSNEIDLSAGILIHANGWRIGGEFGKYEVEIENNKKTENSYISLIVSKAIGISLLGPVYLDLKAGIANDRDNEYIVSIGISNNNEKDESIGLRYSLDIGAIRRNNVIIDDECRADLLLVKAGLKIGINLF